MFSGDFAYLTLHSRLLLPPLSSSKAIKGLFSCHNGSNFGVLIRITMLCKMLCSADMQQGSKSVDRGYDIVVPLIHDEVMTDAMRSWYV